MSHDTDKLIRQLSLVAFLMAERRPLTARDVKSNVEGYSEMSDEAFARRFYSDRAELQSLGVPLRSQRDEFTGEELYTLKSDQYFLPPLEISDEELAALHTALALLDEKFAYAEPLRLALQNLALGRPGFSEVPTETALRVKVEDPDYSEETASRLGKLESAISKQRTVRFPYRSMSSGEDRERIVNPFALLREEHGWYVIGEDVEDRRRKTFRVSRMSGDIRFHTRRERDFRVPGDFNLAEFRDRPPWQIGNVVGTARIEVAPETAWWVERAYGRSGSLTDGVFETQYANVGLLASWILRQDGRARPLEPAELRKEVVESLRRVTKRHESRPPRLAAEVSLPEPAPPSERSAGPVAPERFGVLQALLAYLLSECGDEREAVVSTAELIERFKIPEDQLQEHLNLLNFVNFGGGCYTVYAQLQGDQVHVDKELFGDTFRSPPRLTPLEGRAIRLALEFVGPMVAAEAHSPLGRVRGKLEETFGQFELASTPEPHEDTEEERLVVLFSDAIRDRRLVEIEYLKEGEETPSTREVEPYSLERALPNWIVHTWDRTRGAERSFRLDRMRSAKRLRTKFELREGFEPQFFAGARRARIWYAPAIARWQLERYADTTPLADGAAIRETPAGSEEWLIGEILSFRGDAVLLEPETLRPRIAERAAELRAQLEEVAARAS